MEKVTSSGLSAYSAINKSKKLEASPSLSTCSTISLN